jgi:hypothetical protein
VITIDPLVEQRVAEIYNSFVRCAGTRRAPKVLDALKATLPYPVTVTELPASEIHACSVTGSAFTDPEQGRHVVTVAAQLSGAAHMHTLAHELFHLAFHRADATNLDEALDYYLQMPEFIKIPRAVARTILADSFSSPVFRDGSATVWEQEAECFATYVVTRSSRITPPLTASPLFSALGSIYAH